jgi:hypothetical protein
MEKNVPSTCTCLNQTGASGGTCFSDDIFCYLRVATLLPRLRSFLGRKSEVLAGQHIIHLCCFLSFFAALQVSRQSLQSCSKHSCTTLSMIPTGPAIMQEAFVHYIVYMVHCVKAGESRKNCGGTRGGTKAGPRQDRGGTVKSRRNYGGTKGGTEAGPRRDHNVT